VANAGNANFDNGPFGSKVIRSPREGDRLKAREWRQYDRRTRQAQGWNSRLRWNIDVAPATPVKREKWREIGDDAHDDNG
jgi:hypothetical protein